MKVTKKYRQFTESEIETLCEDFCLATGATSANYTITPDPQGTDVFRQILEIIPAEGDTGAICAPAAPDLSILWNNRKGNWWPHKMGSKEVGVWLRMNGDLRRDTLRVKEYKHSSFLGYTDDGAEFEHYGDDYVTVAAVSYTLPDGRSTTVKGRIYDAFIYMKEGCRALTLEHEHFSPLTNKI